MSEAPEIALGSAGSRLRLRVLKRLYPELSDYWDGNWLACEIRAEAGAFSGTGRATGGR